MSRPPESFLIFREELQKEKLEKARLAKEYENRILELKKELSYLVEQIAAQQEMIKTTINYASKLEQELETFKHKVVEDRTNGKRNYH